LLDKAQGKRPPREREDELETHCHALNLVQEGGELIAADRDVEAIAKIHEASQLDHSVDFNKTVAQSFLKSGTILLRNGKIPGAVEDFQQAKKYMKVPVQTLLWDGDSLARGGQIDAAVKAFRGVQNLDPSQKMDPETRANKARAAALLQEGNMLASQEKIQEAVRDFTSAQALDPDLKLDPKDPKISAQTHATKVRAAALLQEGDKLASQGNIQEAAKNFIRAQELDPSQRFDPETRANKARGAALLREGDLLASAGKIDEAVKVFKNAQELDPSLKIDPQTRASSAATSARLQNALDALKNGTAQVKQVVAEFSKAEQLDSKIISAFNWNDLCWLGTLLDGAKDVLNACDRAVQSDPKNWHILDSRGLARALANDVPGAIVDFQVVVTTADNGELKTQRQTWLDALKGGQNPFSQDVMDNLRKQSGLVSIILICNRIPDLEVLHAFQRHDPVKSGYASKPGRRPEDSGTR
jgi:tetratricopeptide (TPR) repeat protein